MDSPHDEKKAGKRLSRDEKSTSSATWVSIEIIGQIVFQLRSDFLPGFAWLAEIPFL